MSAALVEQGTAVPSSRLNRTAHLLLTTQVGCKRCMVNGTPFYGVQDTGGYAPQTSAMSTPSVLELNKANNSARVTSHGATAYNQQSTVGGTKRALCYYAATHARSEHALLIAVDGSSGACSMSTCRGALDLGHVCRHVGALRLLWLTVLDPARNYYAVCTSTNEPSA